MGGFNNPVVGALALIRQAMRSPNYVAGSAGWSINKDGSAEFNDLTVRGKLIVQSTDQGVFVYKGTPGPGTLIVALAPASGVDPYGNAFAQGIYMSGYLSGDTVNALVLQPKNVGGSNFQPAEIFTRTDPSGENQTWISSPYDTTKGENSAAILLRGSDATNGGGCSIFLDAFTTTAGDFMSTAIGDSSAMASVPSFSTTGSFVPFTGAQWPSLTITCPPSETIVIGTRMTGYNNNSTSSTIAVGPQVKQGSTVLLAPSLLRSPLAILGSTTLTNGLQGFVECVVGQDVLGGQAGKTLTIVPNWRISSGSAATCNINSAGIYVVPSVYTLAVTSA